MLTAGVFGGAAAVLSFAAGSPAGTGPAAEAQAARTVTVDPGPLQPGDMATVHWSGFTPDSPAYVYVCQGSQGALPRAEACYGQTLVSGQTGPDGTGSARFQVRSALYPFEFNIGGPKYPGGTFGTDCRNFNGCQVIVTECSSVIDPGMTAGANYQIRPADPGTYDDDPLVKIDWVTQDDEDGDGLPDLVARLSPRPIPPPDPEPGPEPVRATGPRIKGNGSDLGGAVHPAWGRAIAEKLNITVNNTTTNDYIAGIESLISGSADFAYTAAPATPSQVARLAAQNQRLVYVPIAVSTIAVA